VLPVETEILREPFINPRDIGLSCRALLAADREARVELGEERSI